METNIAYSSSALEYDTSKHSIECTCRYCEKNDTGYFAQFKKRNSFLKRSLPRTKVNRQNPEEKTTNSP